MDHLIANIDQRSIPMSLYIKNNLTHLERVGLMGKGSSAFLEAVEVKKKLWFSPDDPTQLISVSDSATVMLRALEGLLDGPSLEHLDMFGFDEMTQLDRRLKRQVDLRKDLRGSDFHVINSLFGEHMARFDYSDVDFHSHFAYPTKTRYRDPFDATAFLTNKRNDDTDLQKWENSIKLHPKKDRDFISNFKDLETAQLAATAAAEVMHSIGYDYKNEALPRELDEHGKSFYQALQEQNFQNYIVINIPLSDIFRAHVPVPVPTKPKRARELVDIDLLGEDESDSFACKPLLGSGQCGYTSTKNTNSLFFMDEGWFNMAKGKSQREQIHIYLE